jgi:7-cyano-7-deazaguanine reductase
VCPRTGYPDFAAIHLLYQPSRLCLELKSWKLYLNAFRMIGTFHETVTAHLFATVNTLLAPRWLLVAGDFFPRGNVDTTVVFETPGARPAGADILLANLSPRCRGFDTHTSAQLSASPAPADPPPQSAARGGRRK